ncbi:hypothetical protein LTR53_000660 [Teratosphaeriaceae sp. CCFEE 6253]|nr:hypothetical protein LTR53_000660 [Teratosphaeriaceae sp. CCFEE 6253]
MASSLLDLPAVLRCRIYAYGLVTKMRYVIRHLRSPALAKVNKQVRAESLPVFFSECAFTARVRSNYMDMHFIDSCATETDLTGHQGDRLAIMWDLQECAGKLSHTHFGVSTWPRGCKALLNNLRHRENFTARFRDVMLFVYASGSSVLAPSSRSTPEHSRMVLRVSAADKLDIQWIKSWGGSAWPKVLALVRGRAKAKAESLVTARKGFMGFTVEELEAVAAESRYWPQDFSVDRVCPKEIAALRNAEARI